ncbi:MAG: hypothetical protein DRJ03_19070 [Chloroflexi bacterium]|nr:MAG: hypothetical protein DRJ03_19070 [Chloroflexota bacterium]
MVTLSDDFNDNSLDTNKWDIVSYDGWGGGTPAGSGSVAEQNQQLEISFVDASYLVRGIVTKNAYDLKDGSTVTARESLFPQDYHYQEIRIMANKHTDTDPIAEPDQYAISWYWYVSESRWRLLIRRKDADTWTTLFDQEITKQDPAKVQIKIVGDKLQVYYDNGAGLTFAVEDTYKFSGTPVYIYLFAYAGGGTHTFTVAFDDFSLYIPEEGVEITHGKIFNPPLFT